MSVLVLRSTDVRRLLPMQDCIEAMDSVLRAHTLGGTVLPLRTVVPVADRGSLYVMPAWAAEPSSLAVKLITLFPGNASLGRETHQGVVVLFGSDGSVEALIEAGSLTAIRTAAVSAVATRALADPGSTELAILGSGVQARSHLESMRAVLPIRRVRVWSRTEEHAQAFAREVAEGGDIAIWNARTPEEAVRGAQVICTVTGSPTPVVSAEWLAGGVHINAVGASTRSTRELDSGTVARARVFVDARESALAEAGDILIPIEEGRIGPEHILGELGEVLLGQVEGRTGAEQVTLFESLGLAIEDAAAARMLAERAGAHAHGDRITLD